MKKTLFVFIASATLLIVGCSKEKKETTTVDELSSFDYKLLPIKKGNDLPSDASLSGSREPIIICTWEEWGRLSKNCHKWGLCDFEWFPDSRILNYGAPIKFDIATSKYYMDILFTSNLPATINGMSIPLDVQSELSALPIDADITVNTKNSYIGRNLIAKAGNYPFNQNLGDFGGYRIWFQ
jgi:hypothetical protein